MMGRGEITTGEQVLEKMKKRFPKHIRTHYGICLM